MKNTTIKSLLVGMSLMGVAHQADAELYNFTNGLASPTVMATLNVTATATTNNYLFELEFISNSGRNNFANLDLVAIATNTADPSTTLVGYSNIATADTPVVLTADGVADSIIPGTTFDYNHAFDFADDTVTNGPVSGRMNSIVVGESVSWVANYSEPLIIDGMTAVFRNNGGNNPFFAELAVSAVPEPETYAMFLAGLGLLGFTARKRKKS